MTQDLVIASAIFAALAFVAVLRIGYLGVVKDMVQALTELFREHRSLRVAVERVARMDYYYDGVKIMMVTTNNTVEKITSALEAGANDFLMKPVTKESLGEKLMILGLVA